MRPRLLASAAAALSAAMASAADPAPLSFFNQPPAVAAQPLEKQESAQPLPGAPQPRPAGDPAPPPVPLTPFQSPLPTLQAPMTTALPADRSLHDDHLGPWNSWWFRGGYTYSWLKNAPIAPTLLSTGSAGSGGPVLLGGPAPSYGALNGLSFDGGLWFNERHTVGMSVGFFFTEQRSVGAMYSSDATGAPLLVRPFFNAALGSAGAQDGFIVSAPGSFTGALTVQQGAHIDGTDINFLFNTANTKHWTTNFLAGFRYFDLDEYIAVNQYTQGINGNTIPFFGGPPVNGVIISDRVRTRNQFYGVQVGGDTEYRFGAMFLDLGVKAALGPNHQITEVGGQTLNAAGAGGPGGFLAVGGIPNGNIGRSTTNNFAVLADATAMLGVQISSHIRFSFGYQFIYLNNVARPAHQFVTTIDPRLVPTAVSFGGQVPSNTNLGGRGTPPFTPVDRDDFFVNTLRFLLEVQY
ncbi:MAG TPA: BBP7 family outer membrane beta-barrel protein [Urbifossiella sp.]|nr:BBP7 family outer membrane beta-barrel protein [Urbifossiella sp.]